MNDQGWLLAFVVTPALVILLGYVAFRLNLWSLHRDHPKVRPGE